MKSNDKVISLVPIINDIDLEEKNEVAKNLLREIREAGYNANFLEKEASLENTKTGVSIDWGTILVAAVSGGILNNLLNLLLSWATRDEKRSITLEIDGDKITISGLSDELQKQMVKDWRERQNKKLKQRKIDTIRRSKKE